MNTKGMKFLAVLAVLAMAFAAFAVVAPAETDDAEGDATYSSTDGTIVVNGTVLQKYTTSTTIAKGYSYYFDSNVTVVLPDEAASDLPIVAFIKEGVTVTFTAPSAPIIGDYDVLSFAYSSYDDTSKKIKLSTAANALFASTSSGAYAKLLDGTSHNKLIPVATALAWDTANTYSQKSVAVNPGDANSAFSLKAMDGTVGFVAAKVLDIWTGTTLTGTVETLNYKANVAVNYEDFTGTIKIGDNEAKLSGFTGTITAASTLTAMNLGAWTAGNIEVTKGTMTQTAATLTIKDDSALTVGAQGTYAIGNDNSITNNGVIINNRTMSGGTSTITNNDTGRITMNGAVSSAITVTNNGTLTVKAGFTSSAHPEYLTIAPNSTGKIINSTDADVGISGTISSQPTVYAANQKVTVTGDLLITKRLTINGVLYIPEGVTVTISTINGDAGRLYIAGPWASIQNYGTIVVENSVVAESPVVAGSLLIDNATLDNFGTIETRCISTTNPTVAIGDGNNEYVVFNNYGSFINESGKVVFGANSQVNNKNAGTMSFFGTLANANTMTFNNAGTIEVAGIVDLTSAALTVNMVTSGASFTANGMVVDAQSVVINNAVAVPAGATTGYSDGSSATVTFAATETHLFQGLTVSSAWTSVDQTYYRSLDLSGILNVVSTAGAAQSGKDVTVTGVITVSKELSIPGQADLVLGNADNNLSAKLIVKGTIAVGQAGGVITSVDDTTYVANTIAVLSGSITSPSIALNDDDVLNAAYFSKPNALGVMYYYMPIKNAIAGAVEMEVSKVTIGNSNAKMSISSDIEIPAGIAVTNLANNGTGLTVDKDCTLTVKDGASLTNSGKITVKGTVYAENARTGIKGTEPLADVKQKGEVDVRYTNLANALANSSAGDVIVITADGVIIADDMTIPEGRTVDTNDKNLTINADKTLTVNGTLFINGGVYTNNGEVVVNGYLITDKVVSYAAGWPAGAYYKFTANNLDYNGICGIDKMDDVIDDEISYAFTVYGDAKASAIDVTATSANKATVAFTDDVEMSTLSIEFATVTFAVGTTVKATVTDGISSASIYAIVGDTALSIADTADAFTIAGKTVIGTLGTKYSFAIDGLATLGVATIPKATINGTVSTAKTVTLDDAKVAGALVADYSGKINATNMTVTGTLTTMDIDTSKTAGAVTITGQLIVGKISKYTGEGAEVSGNVTLGSSACAIVVNGSSIDEEIVDGLKVTTITVDKKPWLTIYGNGTANLSKFVIPVTNGQATYFGTTALVGNYLPDGTSVTIGDKATIDITVKYNIYNVTIITDSGIKSVSIDNIEMIRDGASNIFNSYDAESKLGVKLEAGTHTVKYTLYNGYEGTAQLYTMDNTVLKDLKFTCSGTDELNYSFQLYGTEQIVTPEPSPVEQNEWTVTTILLVILVILIAIMAVIVALRLNRS